MNREPQKIVRILSILFTNHRRSGIVNIIMVFTTPYFRRGFVLPPWLLTSAVKNWRCLAVSSLSFAVNCGCLAVSSLCLVVSFVYAVTLMGHNSQRISRP